MPADSDNDDDLVFLSPGESPDREQGPFSNLRRSTRKRKSVGAMSKNSAKKKKGTGSPQSKEDPGRPMPKIPRTPQGATQQEAPS